MRIDADIATQEKNLLHVILTKNLLSPESLLRAQSQATIFQQTLFQTILQYQLIDPEKFCNACIDLFKISLIALENKKINHFCFDEIPSHIIKNYFLLPITKKNKQLIIAIANPNDIEIANTISFQTGLSVQLLFTRYDTLCRLHNAYMSERCYRNFQGKDDRFAQTITHQLLSDAIHRNASDMHFEPYQQHFRVRFRMDGLLHEIIFLPTYLIDAISSCIKVLAHLDIAIKRMPQDGRLTFHSYLGFFKDCRVSTCPTIHGEKIVVRLLDANTQARPIEQLGLSTRNQKIILDSISQPQGLILVTGPTGSGKTITLYTLLNLLNQYHRNITTIEDPVEMQIDGINQTHINTKMGLTFSHTLRALLRQDPDVIMIGEIRDQETAEMAIRAAQTGHLVLSTLHTNSAPEAITRLTHMGIAPFHLSAALTLVIAQRLVRKLCPHCKIQQLLSESEKIPENFFEAQECAQCTNGFQGRIGVFELMPINATLKKLILNHESSMTIEKQNKENGNVNLWQSALETVCQGLTSLNEIYRVIPYEK